MTLPPFLRLGLLYLFLAFSYCANAQYQKRVDTPLMLRSPAQSRSPYLPISLPVANTAAAQAVCNNSTFLLRLKANPGERIEVVRLGITSGNSYIVAGNYFFADGRREGMLVELDPLGNIKSQKWIRVQNRAVKIQDLLITSDGAIFVAGSFRDAGTQIFIGRWNYALARVWTHVLPVPETPRKMKLDMGEQNRLLMASQITNAVHYSALYTSGIIEWTREAGFNGLTELIGFQQAVTGQYAIAMNTNLAGKSGIQVADVNSVTGAVIRASFIGNGTDTYQALASTGFNFRLQLLGWQNNTGIIPFRDALAESSSTETRHTYTLPQAFDATVTGALDRAGDAIGFFFPGAQELVFVKHFAYPQTQAEYSRKYTVANGKNIQSITRTYDGGFLFGMGSVDSSEIILLKADSLGALPGCGAVTQPVVAVESLALPTTPGVFTTIPAFEALVAYPVQEGSISLISQFNCRNQICPPEPPADTCLATYNKYFRSGNYAEVIDNYFLMQGNRHIWYCGRYDRLFGSMNEVTYNVKLLDESGHVIKTVSVYDDQGSSQMTSFQLSENRILLVGYPVAGTDQALSLQVLDDNLNLLMKKTFKASITLYSGGTAISDATMDAEGNYYITGTTPGYFSDSASLFIHKFSSTGTPIWTRLYKTRHGNFLNVAMTTSPSYVHLVVETGGADDVSVCLAKSNGNLLSASSFPVQTDNSIYKRALFYYNGRLYYSGSNKQSEMALVKFDSLGRVLQVREVQAPILSLSRNAAMRDGNMYSYFLPFDVTRYKSGIIKTDTNLNVIFNNYYNFNHFGLHRGIGVSPQQFIYTAGNHIYGGVNASYSDPFQIKLDSMGNIGTCTPDSRPDPFSRTFPTPGAVLFVNSAVSIRDSSNTTFLAPDTTATNISTILCSSTPLCSQIDLGTIGAVCQLNTDYAIPYSRNPGCTVLPQMSADTSSVRLIRITDTTIVVQFRKNGFARIRALLNAGCTFFSDSVDVNVQEVPITISLGRDTLLCPGDSLKLSAGSGYASYRWQDGSTDSVYTAYGPGTYYVEIQNSCGDKRSDTLQISAAVIPLLTLGPDQQVCANDTVTLQASPGFATYNWSPASLVIGTGATVKVAPLRDTTLSVLALTINGCKARDTLALTLKFPPVIRLGNDTSFCASDSITLSAGSGFLQYQWNTGATTEQLVVKRAGTYSITARAVNGCFARDTLRVLNVYTLPIVNLGANRGICENTTLTLNAGNFASYLWQDNSVGASFTLSDTGWYSVRVTDIFGCKGGDSIYIPVKNPNPAGFLNQVDTLCSYDKLEIVPKQTYSSYSWSTGNTTGRISVTRGGLYTLSVTDANGCRGTDSILVVEKQCLSGMFLPNAFTPNRNGLNDVFRAKAYGPLASFELNVYNRYGQLIFSSKDSNRGWDGTIRGLPAEMGNYVWTCSYQFVGREKEFQRGFVLLIR